MSSSTLQAEVFIDESANGKPSTGYLEVVTSEDILIDTIMAEIHLEVRGRMNSTKDTLTSFPIITQPTLIKADEENILPFTFVLKDPVESYDGYNANLGYTCEVTMHVNKADFSKLGLSVMSSIKSFMTSDRRLRTLKKFDVQDQNHTYNVVERSYDFGLEVNYIVPIVVAFILFLSYVLFIPEMNVGYIILGVIIIIFSAVFTHYFMKSSLGRLTMRLHDGDENFSCFIAKTRNFNLKEQKLYYEIVEKVVDRRGTKTTTHIEVLYTSPFQTINNSKKNPEFIFPYVDNPNYASKEIDDVTVFWRMCVVGVSNLGLKLKYTSEFVVHKNKPIYNKEGLVKF